LTSVGVWRTNYSSLALLLVILASNGRQNGNKASLSRPQPSPTFPPQCRTSEDGKTDNLFSVSTRTMERSAVTKSPWQPARFRTSNLSVCFNLGPAFCGPSLCCLLLDLGTGGAAEELGNAGEADDAGGRTADERQYEILLRSPLTDNKRPP